MSNLRLKTRCHLLNYAKDTRLNQINVSNIRYKAYVHRPKM